MPRRPESYRPCIECGAEAARRENLHRGESSATVILRWRRPSCSASVAASGPTSRSKRKQSTTVRAGEVIRAGTPSNVGNSSCAFAPLSNVDNQRTSKAPRCV